MDLERRGSGVAAQSVECAVVRGAELRARDGELEPGDAEPLGLGDDVVDREHRVHDGELHRARVTELRVVGSICYVAVTNAERRDDTKRPVSMPSGPPVPPAYRPAFPSGYRPGVGIIGCGGIVKLAHLPAYTAYGVDVVGVFDASSEATERIQERFPVVGQVFASVDELLADPRIDIVDIATHPGVRRGLIEQAIDAGKHVLSQKPFAVDLAAARALVDHAERRGVRLAVNQNGRWAPPWRVGHAPDRARSRSGRSVPSRTCSSTTSTGPSARRTTRSSTSCSTTSPSTGSTSPAAGSADKSVSTVSAREYRTPAQAAGQKAPWGALVVVDYTDGASAVIRSVGVSTRRAGNPFWVHGTEGTIRGSIRKQTDFVELERDGTSLRYSLCGEWLPDGFAGTMAELCSAIAEDREPFNSARHNLLTLELTLAACRSAEEGGRPVALAEVDRRARSAYDPGADDRDADHVTRGSRRSRRAREAR